MPLGMSKNWARYKSEPNSFDMKTTKKHKGGFLNYFFLYSVGV